MALTTRQMIALGGIGSALLLGGAFAFQLAGYAPCHLCITQRWPHAAAIAVAILGWLVWPRGARAFAWLGLVAMALCVAIAVYHTGVELKWWAGPMTCSGGGAAQIGNVSAADLLARLQTTHVVRCDAPAVLIAGLSMAAWNALFSLGLCGWWARTLRRA